MEEEATAREKEGSRAKSAKIRIKEGSKPDIREGKKGKRAALQMRIEIETNRK